MPHVPVLLQEVLDVLDPNVGEFFIDGTAGGGGHARELLARVGRTGKVLAIDWDATQANALKKSLRTPHAYVVHGNYTDLPMLLKEMHLSRADGLLLDLGFSTEHIEHSGRGFSFVRDEPLLMTYDDSLVPVKDLLRRMHERELAHVLFRFGEERYARRIAGAIKEAERKSFVRTSGALAEIIVRAVPKQYAHGRIHPATRTFQALRILANRELENLETLLRALPEVMNEGGRVAVISFHSLEDRIVKNAFRALVKEKQAELISKKPITPTLKEQEANPKARSAKLRALLMTHA